jgi:hypothetical protein
MDLEEFVYDKEYNCDVNEALNVFYFKDLLKLTTKIYCISK